MIASVQFDRCFFFSWGVAVWLGVGLFFMFMGLIHAAVRWSATARDLLLPGEAPFSKRDVAVFYIAAAWFFVGWGVAMWMQEVEDYVWSWNR